MVSCREINPNKLKMRNLAIIDAAKSAKTYGMCRKVFKTLLLHPGNF